MRRIAILDAPSNLGLRPPTATSTPGCAKAPGALRDQGLLARLGARDAGCLTPPRYDPGDWRPGDGVCHASAIAAYSVALAGRVGAIIDAGEFPLILGGDCSILLGSALAMHRLGEAVGGRIGLVFVDGHSDFRHPGNASYVGAAAGEDLALATGRGQANLAAIEGRRPYFRDVDVVVLGVRAQDEYRLDLQAAGIVTRPVPALRVEGAARSAQWARDQLADCAGYWVHVDVDVLDPAVMPAVDAPDPGGIAFAELELLIAGLVDSPHCLGLELTVFDPDYDPDGAYAAEITAAVVAGLEPITSAGTGARTVPGPVAAPHSGPVSEKSPASPSRIAVSVPTQTAPEPTLGETASREVAYSPPRSTSAPPPRSASAAPPQGSVSAPPQRSASAPPQGSAPAPSPRSAPAPPPRDTEPPSAADASTPVSGADPSLPAGPRSAADPSLPAEPKSAADRSATAEPRSAADPSLPAEPIQTGAIPAAMSTAATDPTRAATPTLAAKPSVATRSTPAAHPAPAAEPNRVADPAEVAGDGAMERDAAAKAGVTSTANLPNVVEDEPKPAIPAPGAVNADDEADRPTNPSDRATGQAAQRPGSSTSGKGRKSAFDVLSDADDNAPARQRRSAADILAAPLGDSGGRGRLRRRPAEDDADVDDATAPGRLRRRPPDEANS